MKNPFEKPARSKERRASIREQDPLIDEAYESKILSAIKGRCDQLAELLQMYGGYNYEVYQLVGQLTEYLGSLPYEDMAEAIDDLSEQDFAVISEAALSSGYQVHGVPKVFWENAKGRSVLLKEIKNRLKHAEYIRDDEDLGAKDLLNVGEMSISEVHAEAVECLRKAIQNGDVAQAEQIVHDIKNVGKEIRISKSDVLSGYHQLFERLSAVGYIDQIPQSLEEVAALKKLTGVEIDGPNLVEVIKEAQVRCLEHGAFSGGFEQLHELTGLIGKQPDWQGALREDVVRLVGDYIGTGRSDIAPSCGIAARIMDKTGVKVEFDEYQQKRLQQAMRLDMRDQNKALKEIFEISHSLDVKIDIANPEVCEDLLGMYRDAISGDKYARVYESEEATKTLQLQTAEALKARGAEVARDFEILHSLRDLRHECGKAMFQTALKDPMIQTFLGNTLVAGDHNDLAIEELFGVPAQEWLKKEKNKDFFARLVLKKAGGMDEYTFDQESKKTEYHTGCLKKCLDMLQAATGEEVEVDFMQEKGLFLEGADQDQEIGFKMLYAKKANLYSFFPELVSKSLVKLMDEAASTYTVQRIEQLQKILGCMPIEKRKEIQKQKAQEIAILFVKHALLYGSRGMDLGDPETLKLSTGGLIPDPVIVEKIHIDFFKKNLRTQIQEGGIDKTELVLGYTKSASHREALKKIIQERVLELFVSTSFEQVQRWLVLTGAKIQRIESAEKFEQVLNTVSKDATLRQLAILFEVGLPVGQERKKVLEKIQQDDRFRYIPELLAFVGPRSREEYCPYKQQIPSILNLAGRNNMERRGVPGAIRYMKEFGFLPIPQLVGVYAQLENARRQSVEGGTNQEITINNETRRLLNAFLNVQRGEQLPEKMTVADIESIFATLAEAKKQLKKMLVEDKLPETFDESPLHVDIFNAMVPTSGNYGSYTDRQLRINSWKLTVAKAEQDGNIERVQLPSGYVKQVFEIERRGADDSSILSTAMASEERQQYLASEEKRVRALREQIKTEQEKKNFTEYLGVFTDGVMAEDMSLWNQEQFVAFFDQLELKEYEVIKRAKKMLETEEGINEKKKTGLEISIQKAEKQIQKIQQARERFTLEYEGTNKHLSASEMLLETMVYVFGPDVGVMAKKEIGIIMLAIAKQKSPVHLKEIREAMEQAGGEVMTDRLRSAWEKWFYEELLEHVGNSQETKLSKDAHAVLLKFFQIQQIREILLRGPVKQETGKGNLHPFHDTIQKIRKLEAAIAGQKTQGETESIGYYPVHGLGRIFAADLANACFNKHSLALAKNEYPNIHADLLVQEDEKRLDILGSSLWIEGETVSGKKVLLIRALNPREDVLNRELSADSIVLATIDRAIGIAQRRGFAEVRMCHDHTGGHATNRNSIFQAEAKIIRNRGYMRSKEDLKSTAETNFNGYGVWRSNEAVVVWGTEAEKK